MKKPHMPFRGPFFDSYRIGANLYRPGERNWRQRTLAGVSWNGRERKAYFFNPDGLALPLTPHPWELPGLLAGRTLRREFATILGTGLFAMSDHQRNALTAASLAEWVTFWLVADDAPYANDPAIWAAFVEADLEAERRATESSIAISQGFTHVTAVPADAGQLVQESVGARRLYLQTEYIQESTEDQRLAAWLRGSDSEPPLLALLGKAA